MANFLGRSALEIVIGNGVFNNLARGIRLAMEEVCEGSPWRNSLLASGRLRLLLLVVLAFLFLAWKGQSSVNTRI